MVLLWDLSFSERESLRDMDWMMIEFAEKLIENGELQARI